LARFLAVFVVTSLKMGIMALRILMTGSDSKLLRADAAKLRQQGFSIFLCNKDSLMGAMIDEVEPDVIFIDSRDSDARSTNLYHWLLDHITFASIPIIYTLAVNDVYLINRKRTAIKELRYTTSDNILDAIELALAPCLPSKKRIPIGKPDGSDATRAKRA